VSRTNLIRATLFALLALVLGLCAVPREASADTSAELQSQLDAANTQLDTLNAQLEQTSEQVNDAQYQLDQKQSEIDATTTQLNDTQTQIDQTEADITKKQADLDAAQEVLSKRISATYKSGGEDSLLSVVLDSSSLEELINNVYYAGKISQSDQDIIQQVKDLKAQLEDQKAQLEDQKAQQQSLLDQQNQQKADLETQKAALDSQKATFEQQQAEQQSYVSSLSQQVQDKITEEREAAAAAARAQAQSSYTYTPGTSTYTGGALTDSQRSAILSAAYSQLGVSYVWAACSPGSAFDCSGFTMYCYGQAGISLPHSSSAQRSMFNQTSISNLQAGDLVFWTGHVAIYAGDGQIIEAVEPVVHKGAIWDGGRLIGGGYLG
jgi:peptidoglycan hydrolase CwlO-like protein